VKYEAFIGQKHRAHLATGLDRVPDLHPALFAMQREVVAWALRKGRAALFEDCGLGKTLQQLEWAHHVPGDVLLLAPLAVTQQTQAEADRWGIRAKVSRDGSIAAQITITNYEQLHRFDLSRFAGLVLDESSILKSHDGAMRTALIEAAQSIPFRLACTATPAPNDHMELANHAEFVGAMSRTEMLATFFVHDGGDTSKWRLKGHAVADFWRWVATWAVMLRRPSDLGHSDDGFVLPPLRIVEHVLATDARTDGELFVAPALTLADQREARRETLNDRVQRVADLVNSTPGPWVVWCELNAEGDALERAIPGAVQVAGADDDDAKVAKLLAFTSGASRVLVTKPKIAGFGMNWQHCCRMAFVGLSHSWEQFYQSVRRCWRFGQRSPVEAHVVSTDREVAVLESVKRKQEAADAMAAEMVQAMAETMKSEVRGLPQGEAGYQRDVRSGDGWTMHLGDCVDVLREMPSDAVGYSVFSPPFASLYTYTASDRDMGNCRTDDEFIEHMRFLVPELLRVTIPGRLLSFHCMLLPSTKERDGVIGLKDFRGNLIRVFEDAGWIFHSEVTIWKDPVAQQQRTKALGLLYSQLRKDSAMSRQGLADYLVTMRKPGANPDPIAHASEDFPVELWQRYAEPVWMDIDQSDTLQYRSAREHADEKHICPLQLSVIRRSVELWSKPGDLVLSPFAGIGSEGYVALEKGRRFVGAELKRSYFEQACKNLAAATAQPSLFSAEVA
jgi:hypothetical protein